jgi:ribosomal protein L12E/L44/L45/RPP1/RPP2
VPTPKQNIRIPRPRWQQAMERAAGQGTDGSKVVNILLSAYNAGDLDDVVARGLESAAAEPVSSATAAGTTDGAGGQTHSASG